MQRSLTIFGIVITALTGAAVAHGQTPWFDPGALGEGGLLAPSAVIVQMNNQFALADITPAELLGDLAPINDAGNTALNAGPGLVAVAPDPALGFAPGRSVRRLHDFVFRAWLRDARQDLSDIQVSYEIQGIRGGAGRLEHLTHLPSALPSLPRVRGPWVIRRFGRWTRIQGGGDFLFDLRSAERAGSYRGTLTVVINSL